MSIECATQMCHQLIEDDISRDWISKWKWRVLKRCETLTSIIIAQNVSCNVVNFPVLVDVFYVLYILL